jgi:hypothetical protein
LILLFAGLAVGGILISKKSLENAETETIVFENNIEPTQAPESETSEDEATSSAEEVDEIDLTDFSVQVLNGSGVVGEAGSVKEKLESDGFENIDTDNADNYDYEKTEVQLKEGTAKEVYDVIEKRISYNYNVVLGDALEEDSQFDIIVIVGEKTEKTPDNEA